MIFDFGDQILRYGFRTLAKIFSPTAQKKLPFGRKNKTYSKAVQNMIFKIRLLTEIRYENSESNSKQMNNAKSTWKWNMWKENCQGMMKRRQTCLRLCYLLWNCSNMIKMNGVNSVKCSLKFWSFKGLGVLASSRLNASNCHDHEILAIPNVLRTTNVRISSLCCIRNRLKNRQISALWWNLASHLCDFDVLSKSKFGLRPENTYQWFYDRGVDIEIELTPRVNKSIFFERSKNVSRS